MSTPFVAGSSAGEHLDGFRLLCVLDAWRASADRMGWEGSNGLALPRDQPAIARLSQPTMRAHPTLAPVPALLSRRGGGTLETVAVRDRLACYSHTAGAAATAADQRKSVPSTHMRCMTTASRRARATLAAFTLPLFAIRMAQDRNDDQRP